MNYRNWIKIRHANSIIESKTMGSKLKSIINKKNISKIIYNSCDCCMFRISNGNSYIFAYKKNEMTFEILKP